MSGRSGPGFALVSPRSEPLFVEEAATIVRLTSCPFAELDRLAHYSMTAVNEEQVTQLSRFARDAVVGQAHLDGIFLSWTPVRAAASLSMLADEVRSLLERLDDGHAELPIEDPGWWFPFAGEAWFVLVFAPLYPPAHPRTAPGHALTHLFLQRESAFERHRDSSGRISRQKRLAVRRRFAADGHPYADKIADHPLEAAKFILPIAVGDPPVRWWGHEYRS